MVFLHKYISLTWRMSESKFSIQAHPDKIIFRTISCLSGMWVVIYLSISWLKDYSCHAKAWSFMQNKVFAWWVRSIFWGGAEEWIYAVNLVFTEFSVFCLCQVNEFKHSLIIQSFLTWLSVKCMVCVDCSSSLSELLMDCGKGLLIF